MKGKQEIAALKEFGRRMTEARSLCKFTIQKSAAQLGINAAALNRLESGVINSDTNITLDFIVKAAKLFDVTSDFLLGLAGDDWERDPAVCFQRQVGAGLQLAASKRLAEVAAQLQQQDRQIEAISRTTTGMLKAVSNMVESIEKFIKLNPEFQNLPGSANLLNRANIAAQATREARCELVRCKIIPLRGINEANTARRQ